MSNTCDVQDEVLEFDPDIYSALRDPNNTKATTHVNDGYVAPRSWCLLKSEDRYVLGEGWRLSEAQIESLVTDADKFAIAYFLNELEDHGPVNGAAKPALQQLRDALIDLNDLDDEVLSDLLWRIPSLFPANIDQARTKIGAGILVTSNLTQPRREGRPKDSNPRAVIAASALIASWENRTLRRPTLGKKKPSIRSFYAKLLPLLRVPSGVRIYPLEGTPYDLFQAVRSFTDEVLTAIEKELVNGQKRPKLR
jgi:hypothetical protein